MECFGTVTNTYQTKISADLTTISCNVFQLRYNISRIIYKYKRSSNISSNNTYYDIIRWIRTVRSCAHVDRRTIFRLRTPQPDHSKKITTTICIRHQVICVGGIQFLFDHLVVTRGNQIIMVGVNLIHYLLNYFSDSINECCIPIREILHIFKYNMAI